MKNKYQRMSKEEKKETRKNYKNSNDLNKAQSARLHRAMFTGVLGVIYGILMIIYSLIAEGLWWEYITYCFVLIFGICLFIKAKGFYELLLNNYLLENTKKSKK